MKYKLLILSMIHLSYCFAQPPDTLWTQRWDWDYEEYVSCVNATNDGYILTGSSRYGDPIGSCWILRSDLDGETIWEQMINPEGAIDGNYIEQTQDGGFVICGSTEELGPHNSWAAYVARLDADGNQLWFRTLSFVFWDNWAEVVRQLPDGGFVCVGNQFLWRISPAGNTVWVTFPEFPGQARPYYVEPSSSGNFYVSFSTSVSGDLFKYDQHGDMIWSVETGYSGAFEHIIELPNGNVLAGGSVATNNNSDRFLGEYTPDGELVWSHLYSGPEDDRITSMSLTADDQLVLCGYEYFLDETDYSEWVAKVDRFNEGSILWEAYFADGKPRSMTIGKDGSIVYGGEDSDFNIIAEDFRITKLEPEVDITLHPWTPLVPESGGWLRYGAQISNILLDSTPLEAWIVVTGPNGNRTPLNQFPVTLQPGNTFTRPVIDVWVPNAAPNGEYIYEVHIGDADTRNNMGLGSFTFVKGTVTSMDESTDESTRWPRKDESWHPLMGDPYSLDYPIPSNRNENSPSDRFEIAASPNPFKSATMLSLTLPTPGDVVVVVYNTLGQEVERLQLRHLNAGRHQEEFDGTHLASGLYFVRATVPGQFDQVYKVMLVR